MIEIVKQEYEKAKELGLSNTVRLLEEKYPELLTPAKPSWEEVLEIYRKEYPRNSYCYNLTISDLKNQTDLKLEAIAKLLICAKVFGDMYPLDWEINELKYYFYYNGGLKIGNNQLHRISCAYFHRDIIDHVRTILGDECIINSLM